MNEFMMAALPWICIGIAIALCAEQVRLIGAKKIYLCADSTENTIAFYGKWAAFWLLSLTGS